jgi:hypothetical protein
VHRALAGSFVGLLARCAETEAPEVVGYYLATALLLIDAGAAAGREVARMFAEREMRERIEAIAGGEGDEEFVADDPLAGDRAPSSLAAMAALVLRSLECAGV